MPTKYRKKKILTWNEFPEALKKSMLAAKDAKGQDPDCDEASDNARQASAKAMNSGESDDHKEAADAHDEAFMAHGQASDESDDKNEKKKHKDAADAHFEASNEHRGMMDEKEPPTKNEELDTTLFNQEPEMAMTAEEREAIVDGLITNCACEGEHLFEEAERPALNQLPEGKLRLLEKFRKQAEKSEIVANGGNPSKKVPVTNQSRLTEEEQEKLAFADSLMQQQKTSLIKTITANSANPFTKDELAGMKLGELSKLAKLAHVPTRNQVAPPVPFYLGNAGANFNPAPVNNEVDEDDILPLPTSYAKKA